MYSWFYFFWADFSLRNLGEISKTSVRSLYQKQSSKNTNKKSNASKKKRSGHKGLHAKHNSSVNQPYTARKIPFPLSNLTGNLAEEVPSGFRISPSEFEETVDNSQSIENLMGETENLTEPSPPDSPSD